MMKMNRVVFVCLAAVMVSAAASASIWWERGDAGSTWQEWYFSTPDNPAVPEAYYNPYGTPSVSIVVEGDIHDPAGWYDYYLGREGVWHGDVTTVTIMIDNAPVANPYKEVWVEVGYRGYLLPHDGYPDYPGELYGPKLTAWVGGVETADVVEIGREILNAGGGWKTLIIGWQIWPNPDREEIFLAFHNSGADIDYIKVDTICIPEPATLAMLVAGLIVLKRKKR